MNERILEFARQTGLCDADGDFFGGKISQYDEFAELIVRECIDTVNSSSECFTADQVYIKKLAVDKIREHFGVKE